MDIRFLGHASFLITFREAKIITDPFDPDKVGLPFPKTPADLVLSSHDHFDHNHVSAVTEDPFVISAPGEYEVKGVKVWGFPTFHDNQEGKERGKNTVYLFEAEGLTLCHLGDLGHLLDQKLEEEIGNPDVLFVPVGGFYTIDATEAAKVVAQLEPRYIIPMHYRMDGMKESFKDLQPVSAFLQEMGAAQRALPGGGSEPRDKLTISKSASTGPEVPEVVVLEPK